MKNLILLTLVVTTQAFAGVYYENFWKTKEVTTCFANAEKSDRPAGEYVLKIRGWKKSDKAKITQWVKEEYSLERTGIYFTGFEDCDESNNADVIIFHSKNSRIKTFIFGGLHGLANLGPQADGVEGYPGSSAYVSISSTGMTKGTVIHEFGHSAGLYHEQDHYDAFKIEGDRCLDTKEAMFSTQLRYTKYDPESVMNYCRLHRKGGNKLGLSPKDVELLKALYP